ncbi:hypothetical protein VTK73DRAFT_6209 [Phialemonium thermophilum]|uniref:Glycoprotease family protein n=1 Tax=Phialemonium thermophilum TaxID=223376 RepID=A0ABR3XVZ4_9PEZI
MQSTQREEWEDWTEDEDEKEPSPLALNEGVPLIDLDGDRSSQNSKTVHKTVQSRPPHIRKSVHRISRMKSRRRQKAQNAKAGIKLETDMSKFREDHVAFYIKHGSDAVEGPAGAKFVDAAALRALEGSPSTATVGSFHWLRRKLSPASPTGKCDCQAKPAIPGGQDLSPDDRPILIGIALPGGLEQAISPQTSVIRTPQSPFTPQSNQGDVATSTKPTPSPRVQHRSVWSPDTEAHQSTFRGSTATPSFYSEFSSGSAHDSVPPIPAIPSTLKGGRVSMVMTNINGDDAESPVTLFEEDGSPVSTRKRPATRGTIWSAPPITPQSQGWWDEVTSPFSASTVFSISPDGEQQFHVERREWWDSVGDKKAADLGAEKETEPSTSRTPATAPQGYPREVEVSSRRAISPSELHPYIEPSHGSVSHPLVNDASTPGEQPPPYSPPSKQQMIRYRAVFPPGHPLNQLYPPSPNPDVAELHSAAARQATTGMAEVPLTPLPPPATAVMPGNSILPDRLLGSFVPGDHFLEVTGNGPRQKAERQRRRHEKEEAVARKIGGLWKGRGCLPPSGCYGRSGREGRKRRRICCGVFATIIVLMVLAIVLGVRLARRPHHSPRAEPEKQWVNLTTFPPMPIGVQTVVGPDNSQAITACTQPTTLWSCSLPKEQAGSVAPFRSNQPTFIFHIEFDNSSDRLWNFTGEPPSNRGRSAGHRRSRGQEAKRQFDAGFSPNPSPPSFQEIWFLGNTTDGIVSKQKAGEPTPFYITMLSSTNQSVGPSILDRRAEYNTSNFPEPDLNVDGTGGPARLTPFPVQQPVRLYDRGLPTEHYGFYVHYDKSIYVKSRSALNESTESEGEVPADQNGGCLETEANFLVIWAQTRFKVEIWTRMVGASRLLSGGPGSNSTRPGTFPYPVTITLDNHGGDPVHKGSVAYHVDDRQRIDTTHVGADNVVLYNLAFNGPWINPAGTADLGLGGIDGGTGGCQCQYTNFVLTST